MRPVKVNDMKLLLNQFDHQMYPKVHKKAIQSELGQETILLINKICKKRNTYLFDLYIPNKIANMLEKVFLLELENAFSQFPDQRMGLVDFITCFLSIVKHKKEHQIFLVSGLIDMYCEIIEYNNSKALYWDHFTNFLIENVIESEMEGNVVKSKYISKIATSKFNLLYNSQHVDQVAPEVIGGSDLCLRRIAPSKKQNDSNHHNQGIRVVTYSPDLRMVMVLDNITEQIMFYNEHSQVVRKLQANKENHILDTAILYIAYSKTEKRIGVCLQDYTLAFWDVSDNFKFEKTFSTDLDVLQIYIKYIEYCGQWITYDQKNILFVWDIERESSVRLPNKHDQRIMDVQEIPHLKLLAVCSLDKKLVFYDLQACNAVQIQHFETVSAHSLAYAHDFMVLLSAAYEDFAMVWNFDGIDAYVIGKLKGHNAQITAINVLTDTPLAITADEIGFIKTWDLRDLNCVQTIHFESRCPIHQFLNINSKKFVGAEIRLHWFEFEDEIKVNANGIELKNNPPINVEYNQTFEQLVITTKSDVRLIDMNSGKVVQILANLVPNDEEITGTRLYLNHKKIILCDNKGNLRTHYLPNGHFYSENVGHQQEITQMYVDFANKLILTTAWDSSICLQQEKKKESQPIRQIKNAHWGQEITCLEVDLRHSMFATSSAGVIFVWDYESFKLISAGTNDNEEVHKLEFLYPYMALVSLDSSSSVVFWSLANINAFQFLSPLIKLKLDCMIPNQLAAHKEFNSFNQMFILKLKDTDLDFIQKETNKSSYRSNIIDQIKEGKKPICLYASDEKGNAFGFNISEIIEEANIVKGKNQMKRHNYYPFRTQFQSSNGMFYRPDEIKQQMDEQLGGKSNCLNIESKELQHIKWWTCAEDILTTFMYVKLPKYLVVTCSNSSLVRMWSMFGEVQCVINLELPLPYKWRVKLDNDQKRQTKLLNSLRITKEIGKRYPKFQENQNITLDDIPNQKVPKVTTFANLKNQIEKEDKEINKCNTISLKQMDLRKSKRIYAAGTSDDYILSKKNKNLNNIKLFEKISTASIQHKVEGASIKNDKQTFGPNGTFIDKIEMMMQKDQKEAARKDLISKKFDEDYKKLKRQGGSQAVFDKINILYASNPEKRDKEKHDQISRMNDSHTLIKNPFAHANIKDITLNQSKSQISFNSSKHVQSNNDWLKYAVDREESLPSILKTSDKRYHNLVHSQMSPSSLINIIDDTSIVKQEEENPLSVPHLKQRENIKARNNLLQELDLMRKHSKSHFKSAQKNQVVYDEVSNEKIGIPLFQKKMKKQLQGSHSQLNLHNNKSNQRSLILPSVSTRMTSVSKDRL